MILFFKKQKPRFALNWLFAGLMLPCLALPALWPGAPGHVASSRYRKKDSHSAPYVYHRPAPEQLKVVYAGPYLSLYTSGRLIRQGRHPKSGVWNTPARKLTEMWVQRAENPTLIRLEPKVFRRQLVELLADFPEVHAAILHRGFTYKGLPGEIISLNEHISKVIAIRQEREGFRAK